MKKILFIVVVFLIFSVFFLSSNVFAQKCLKGHEERVVASGYVSTQIQCHVDYCTEIPVYIPEYEEKFICDKYLN
jgi:hypothetical protein